MMSPIALAALIIAAMSLIAGGAAAAQWAVSRKSELQSRLARDALTFFLARGPEDSCGPGCREWIAAEGQFDEGSAARFRVHRWYRTGRKLTRRTRDMLADA
jgi:hypothetical protein